MKPGKRIKISTVILIAIIVIFAIFAILVRAGVLRNQWITLQGAVLARVDNFLLSRDMRRQRIPILKYLISINDYPVYRSNLGETYFYMGRYDEAEKEIKKALESDKRFITMFDAEVLLSRIYLMSGRKKEAIEELRKVNKHLGNNFSDREAQVVFGMVLFTLDTYDKATRPDGKKRTPDLEKHFSNLSQDFANNRYAGAREEIKYLLDFLEKSGPESGEIVRKKELERLGEKYLIKH
ncbi:MAG: tetratricopeptide repeat protein [Chloroflexi bacterium]|nr:tetratricopeptide repeat protein [Chloroflexota bacterium]